MSNVANLIVQVGMKLVRTKYPDSVLGLLIEVYQEEQNPEYVKQINEKLDRLINGHFKAGMDHLGDASRSRSQANRLSSLQEAKRELILAANIDEPFYRLQAKYFTGITHGLLGDLENASVWYDRSYDDALMLQTQIAQKLNGWFSNKEQLEHKRTETRVHMRSISTALYHARRKPEFWLEKNNQKVRIDTQCSVCRSFTVRSSVSCNVCGSELPAQGQVEVFVQKAAPIVLGAVATIASGIIVRNKNQS